MALTGAMSAGISGLKAHMEALNTVGNNIANVNTYGYKPGRVTFRESMYSTQSAGAAGTATVGGTNPRHWSPPARRWIWPSRETASSWWAPRT